MPKEKLELDMRRLQFILLGIKFLIEMRTQRSKLPANNEFNRLDFDLFEQHYLTQCRKILSTICEHIGKLSDTFQTKYKDKDLLKPDGFTWVTFEQFGGIISHNKDQIGYCILWGRAGFDLKTQEAIDRFIGEHKSDLLLAEASMEDIIEHDLPQLGQLVNDILLQNTPEVGKGELTVLKPISLVRLKSITNQIRDTYNLVNLISSLNFSDDFKPDLSQPITNDILTILPEKPLLEDKLVLMPLSDEFMVHYYLRIMEQIGELITGRNLSRLVRALDPSINWQAFVDIRDGLIHQDERDNKYRVDSFIQDPSKLKTILFKEFNEFRLKLIQLLLAREQKIGPFEDDAAKHWRLVFNAHNAAALQSNNSANNNALSFTKDQEEFLNFAVKHYTKDEIKIFEEIFAGTKRLDRKALADLLNKIHFKKNDSVSKDEYKSLFKLVTEANNGAKTTEKERQEKIALEQLAKQKKEEAREEKFSGLEEIRNFAKLFSAKETSSNSGVNSHYLSPRKRLEAAIKAIENIEKILIQCGYNLSRISKGFQACEQLNLGTNNWNLLFLLEHCSHVKGALEYNLGQALQHLDKIFQNIDCAKTNKYLQQNYPVLRDVRNRLEHGDHFVDNMGYNITEKRGPQSYKNEQMAPEYLHVIKDLLPELKDMLNHLQIVKQSSSLLTFKPSDGDNDKDSSGKQEVTEYKNLI